LVHADYREGPVSDQNIIFILFFAEKPSFFDDSVPSKIHHACIATSTDKKVTGFLHLLF